MTTEKALTAAKSNSSSFFCSTNNNDNPFYATVSCPRRGHLSLSGQELARNAHKGGISFAATALSVRSLNHRGLVSCPVDSVDFVDTPHTSKELSTSSSEGRHTQLREGQTPPQSHYSHPRGKKTIRDMLSVSLSDERERAFSPYYGDVRTV